MPRPSNCAASRPTARTDIYTLGVIAYEMLTGRRPFEAVNRMTLINQTLSVEPVPPAAHGPACRERRRGHPAGAGQRPGGALAQRDRVRARPAGGGRRGGAGAGRRPTKRCCRAMTSAKRLARDGWAAPSTGVRIARLACPWRFACCVTKTNPLGRAARAVSRRSTHAAGAASQPAPCPGFRRGRTLVYLVTDLIEGPSLRDELPRSGSDCRGRACGLVQQMLDATAALNAAEASSSGVNPDMIRLTHDGGAIASSCRRRASRRCRTCWRRCASRSCAGRRPTSRSCHTWRPKC